MAEIDPKIIASFLDYFPDTGEFKRKKYLQKGKTVAGETIDTDGYVRISAARKSFRAHRLAWVLFYGEWPKLEIDHINGNKADNRIINLRECTRTQNNHNTALSRRNKSGVKGVSRSYKGTSWHVQVTFNKKIHSGGYFKELSDAESAAIALREKLHGEFANHG